MTIIWSPLAEETYYENLEYLDKNWSKSVVRKFINDVDITLTLLKTNPEIFHWWDAGKNIRIGYINKHISFFYSLEEKSIFIHLFWNNHRQPSVLKKFL